MLHFGHRRSHSRQRLPAVLCTLWLLSGLVLPVRSAAHTALLRSTPAAGATLTQPPREVRLWFSEPIERQFSRIEVFLVAMDAATGTEQPGPRIDQGWLPGPRTAREVGVRLPETLAPGRYLVQWNVLAIDAHRTQGSFLFSYARTAAP